MFITIFEADESVFEAERVAINSRDNVLTMIVIYHFRLLDKEKFNIQA